MNRWSFNHESTGPKTLLKSHPDESDTDYLINWLFYNDMKIDFGLYKGKEKPELLNIVRAYHDKFRQDLDLMETLQGILHQEDWDALQVASVTFASESDPPAEPCSPSDSPQGIHYQEDSDTPQVTPETLTPPSESPVEPELHPEPLQGLLQVTAEL